MKEGRGGTWYLMDHSVDCMHATVGCTVCTDVYMCTILQVTIPDVLPVLSLMWPHAGQGIVERLQSPAGRMPAVFMIPSATLKMTVQGGTVQGIDAL